MQAQTTLPTLALTHPAGFPRITLAQVEKAAAQPHRAGATTPGRALAALKRAEAALGIGSQVVRLLDYLTSRTRTQDWETGGVGPVAWPSDDDLQDRLGVGRSRCKEIVRAALDAGLVRMRRSANGRRYGRRDRDGRIVQAFGFDLSPLAERQAELERLAAEWEARRAEGRRLRREIACERTEVLGLAALASAEGYDGEDWDAVAAQAEALMRARGNHRDPLALIPVAARLRALQIRIRELVEAAARCRREEAEKRGATSTSGPVECVETGPTGPLSRPHYTTTHQPKNQSSTEDRHPPPRAPDRPAAGPASRPEAREAARGRPGAESGGRGAPGTALRGFVLTPDDVLRLAPAFRAWVTGSKAGWAELGEAAFYVCSELSISRHAWGQACVALGRMEAVAALAVIATRHAANEVRSPEGLLRKMVTLHQAGALHLDRSLYGLANRARR